MATFYVRNTGGNSNDVNTYSLISSAGAAGVSLPTIADDLILDAGSGNFTQNAALSVRSFDTNGYTGVFTQNTAQLLAIGDGTAGIGNVALRMSPLMTYIRGGSANITFEQSPTGTPQSISSGGHQIGTVIFGNTAAGNWELLDALNSGGTLLHTRGAFKGNGYSITCQTFNSSNSNSRTIDIEGCTIVTTAAGGSTVLNFQTATNLTLLAETAVLTIASSSSTRTIQMGSLNLRFGTIKYDNANSSGSLTLGASYGTILKLMFSDSVTTRTLLISGSNWDIRDWSDVYGRSGANIEVRSSTAGAGRFVKVGAATIQTLQYADVKDVYLRTPAKLFAINCVDVSNNKNIVFGAAGAYPYNRQSVIGTQTNQSSANVPFDHQAEAGNLLIAYLTFISDPGAITAPSGWLLAHEHSRGVANYTKMYYKVADGSETDAAFSWMTSRTSRLIIDEWYNFQGVPTLDTVDQNDVGVSNSLSTGAGASNSAAPALSVALLGSNGGLGVSTADPTNGFGNYWDLLIESTSAIQKIAVKPVTDIASRETTFAWNTARQAATVLVNFIDVATGRKIKLKQGGVFAEYDHKVKVGGVFV